MQMDDGIFADLRVVILDDSRNFQTLLRTMLRQLGFRRIDSFFDPAEAMTFVADTPVDLVFVDFVMPGQNGAQWVHAVRRRADIANPEMALVLVTGSADHATIDMALAAGVDDVLAKPLAAETLLRHIRMVLSRPRRYVRTAGGYYGPEIGPTLQRLRQMARPKAQAYQALARQARAANAAAVTPATPPAPQRDPRRTLPGLDAGIRPASGSSEDAAFLD